MATFEIADAVITTVVPAVLGGGGFLARRWYKSEGPLWSSLNHQKAEIEELRVLVKETRDEYEERDLAFRREIQQLHTELNVERSRVWRLMAALREADIAIPDLSADSAY